jgi:hypothetical protein
MTWTSEKTRNGIEVTRVLPLASDAPKNNAHEAATHASPDAANRTYNLAWEQNRAARVRSTRPHPSVIGKSQTEKLPRTRSRPTGAKPCPPKTMTMANDATSMTAIKLAATLCRIAIMEFAAMNVEWSNRYSTAEVQ